MGFDLVDDSYFHVKEKTYLHQYCWPSQKLTSILLTQCKTCINTVDPVEKYYINTVEKLFWAILHEWFLFSCQTHINTVDPVKNLHQCCWPSDARHRRNGHWWHRRAASPMTIVVRRIKIVRIKIVVRMMKNDKKEWE